MTDETLDRVVVPVASRDDAVTTARALVERLEDGDVPILVHVVEKAGGAPDKASVEQRETEAGAAFDAAGAVLEDAGIEYETRVLYGTDVVDAILEAAGEVDASAIAFTPRGGSRLAQLLTGDVARNLIERTDRPVVTLPAPDEDAGADDQPGDEAEERTASDDKSGGETGSDTHE